jgi:hypothetical protein
MKMRNACFVVLMALVACSSPDKKEKENIALVEDYIEAVENLDYQAMSNFLADGYVGRGPNYGDSVTKDSAVENWKYVSEFIYDEIDYRKSFNVAMSIPSGENRGDWVSNWAELHIRYLNGTEVTLWANSVYRIEEGKIVRSLTFYNEMDALRQLGFQVVSQDD